MIIKQLSIFVENKTGKLAQVTGMIADLGVNIHALSIADTTDFGVLRIIVDNPELTADELRSNRMTVSVGDVICVNLENRPGGLTEALRVLYNCGISVEYVYAFSSPSSDSLARVVLRVDDPRKADAALREKGFE
ncbi:MAG: ACT domain-containing protein [Clostridia bacterium]|nr:ACT domain-containing protein [Clostridia bacterium]